MSHDYALRTPWYVLARDADRTLLDPSAREPSIQKYDTAEFVGQLLDDPRSSLKFDSREDVWSYPVFLGKFPGNTSGRGRFATHTLVPTGLRKLYQPHHDRFYALAIELFCDAPGFPSPGDLTGVDLKFVVRRERTILPPDPTGKAAKAVHELARKVIRARYKGLSKLPTDALGDSDVAEVLGDPETRGAFEAEYEQLMLSLGARHIAEAWTVAPDGRGSWHEVEDATPENSPELASGEQELPMWRRPPGAGECAAAQHRSLWFGVVPTFSGDMDEAGRPKLDDHSVYRMHCFAKKQPPPGHEHCPPRMWWSGPTRRYRLAAFHDPSGTKNRRVTITAPDFRAVAARAGLPAGPGGVEILRPPGSQLTFDPNNGSPKNGEVGGTAPESCTYALEVFTIVAMFVFALFLPVVTFLFQLWWLLTLRFCTPAPGNAFALLESFFDSGATLAQLPDFDSSQPERADRAKLDEVFGVTDSAALLGTVGDPENHKKIFADSPSLLNSYIGSLDPADTKAPAPGTPEPAPRDPRCTSE
ncbi:hypothetical protein TUSST3_64830 [Streptomyces sp. TUS-ST3]|uniref:hypothetical protein n=1 Tax=Streptomyces sp. TUS-ST3 TaxID=3025591 RepID=UPI00235B37D1|nr:hypothetical protein [Streptomyces sp. TUS-ST3]GLP69862.1 hypothetical protein TUSST3_64830 [Streptomyces sp. TUS-ST3]